MKKSILFVLLFVLSINVNAQTLQDAQTLHEEGRKILSEERASTVAEYLIGLNVRDRFHVFTQGFGAERPVATNRTEEGKARNRRVEITIMDK